MFAYKSETEAPQWKIFRQTDWKHAVYIPFPPFSKTFPRIVLFSQKYVSTLNLTEKLCSNERKDLLAKKSLHVLLLRLGDKFSFNSHFQVTFCGSSCNRHSILLIHLLGNCGCIFLFWSNKSKLVRELSHAPWSKITKHFINWVQAAYCWDQRGLQFNLTKEHPKCEILLSQFDYRLWHSQHSFQKVDSQKND